MRDLRRSALLLCLASACDPGTEPVVPVRLDVSPDSLNFEALAVSAGLTATVYDRDGKVITDASVAWRSSSTPVATVDQAGLVTAADNGSAYVVAVAGDARDSARVAVRQKPVSLRILPAGSLRLEALGDTVRLTADVLDANGQPIAGTSVDWAAADTTILTVDRQGLVTAVDNGTTTILATSGGLADSLSAEVEQVPAQVRLSPARDPLRFESLGDTVRLSAEVLDSNGHPIEGVSVTWSVSDTTVATVDRDGLVTARGNGTAAVSASTRTVTGTARVEVDQVPVVMEVLSARDLLATGDSIQVTAEAFDAGGSRIEDAAFMWTSSDTTVATVDSDGWVHALEEGSIRITATLKGLSASAGLTVAGPDKTALLYLFRSANGKLWTRSGNWGTDAPLAEWHGVHVDARGRVDSLVLTLNNLAGPIPPEIGKLTGLKYLHLEANLLTGGIPPEIGGLESLRWLGLFGNHLEGPLPAEIADLDQLRILDLSFNGFTGSIPAGLTRLPHLWYVGLFFNELTGEIPPEIGDFPSLRVLDLSYNRLTGPIPPEIGNLEKLESLLLFGIDTNPEEGNRLTGAIPPEIGNLANLRVLNLGANLLEGPIPPELGKLAKLDSLGLYSNLLTDLPPELGELADLQYLSLYGNRLTGSIPVEIGELANLHTLLLGRGFTSGNNALSGSIPGELGDLARLEKLDLGGNRLTGPIPRELGRLSRLEFLELGSNGLSGPIPAELGNLTRLTRLAVCPNELSGPIPGEIGKMRALYYLFLCSNSLSGDLPSEIGNLTSLRHIHLGANRLTGELPRSMLSLKRLLEFRWPRNDGLCAPGTEEFEEWLESIPSSSDIYCESESMYVNRTDTGAANAGGCLVTVAAARSAGGRGPRDRRGGMGGIEARLRARAGEGAGMGPPATLVVPCEAETRSNR
ncbi:MAG: Ig-like domain-containing protein [Gemmatimonadota bacterium]|nr:Ig-like domain-containing protein [Gemmatimonadota bacterium]MDE2871532.1 Ig-like domain-containing protein [Gemmatimonadota bacterium]